MGAPAHRLVAVRERLRELFGQRVIALYHNVEWSPRSPDLTPCDFFLWGYLKSKVYTSPPVDLADLQNRISNEVDALRKFSGDNQKSSPSNATKMSTVYRERRWPRRRAWEHNFLHFQCKYV